MPGARCPNVHGSVISVLTGGCVGIRKVVGLICKTLNPTIFERDFLSWVWGETHLTLLKMAAICEKCGFVFIGFFVAYFSSTQQTPPPPQCAPGRLPELKRKQSWTESALNVPGNILHMPTTLKQTTYVTILHMTTWAVFLYIYRLLGGKGTAGCSVSQLQSEGCMTLSATILPMHLIT